MDLYSSIQTVHPVSAFFTTSEITKRGKENLLPFIMLVKLYEVCSLSSSLCMHTRMYSSKIERSASKFSCRKSVNITLQ
jgi:hypothetical protein